MSDDGRNLAAYEEMAQESHDEAKRLREALGIAGQALTVAANAMTLAHEHALFNRALRAVRKALKP